MEAKVPCDQPAGGPTRENWPIDVEFTYTMVVREPAQMQFQLPDTAARTEYRRPASSGPTT